MPADEGEGQAADQGAGEDQRRQRAAARRARWRRPGRPGPAARRWPATGPGTWPAQVSSSGAGAEGQQVQRAVLVVALEQPLERQQRRPGPGPPRPRPAAMAASRCGLRPDGQRQQGGDAGVEAQRPPAARRRGPRPAPVSRREQDRPGRLIAPISSARGRRSAGGRARRPGSGRRRPGASAISSPKRARQRGVERAPAARPAATAAAARPSAGPGPGAAAGRPTAGAPPGRAGRSAPARRRRPRRRGRRPAGPARLERQLLAGRARRLQPVLVADQVQAVARARRRLERRRRRRSRSRPASGRHQAGDGAQQAGLARAVGARSARTASPAARRSVRPANSRRSPRATRQVLEVQARDHGALKLRSSAGRAWTA